MAALLGRPEARAAGQQAYEYIVATIARRTGWDKPRTESGEPAWIAVREIELEIENFAYAIAQEASSAEWLFFIRLAPYVFMGHEPDASFGYLTSHAETISALSARPTGKSIPAPGNYRGYQIDPGSMHRLGAVALLLAQVQNLLRCAGKGCVVTSRPGSLPGVVPNPAIDEMTALWDNRMSEPRFAFLSRAGLYSHKLHARPSIEDDSIPLVQHFQGKYAQSHLPLAAIPTLSDIRLPEDVRFPKPVLDLIVLLVSGNFFRIGNKGTIQTDIADFERTGANFRPLPQLLGDIEIALELIRRKTAARSIPETIRFDSPAQIFNRLVGDEVELWPPSFGPAIRPAGDNVFLRDIYGATQRLEKELSRPPEAAGTPMANIWSEHFEDVIQETIDSTGWKPSPELAKLRRVKLKAAGKEITDLDGVGENANRALLVDCKDFPFSKAWERGEYGAVRNLASDVDKAVRDWDAKMATLRAQPVGGNYDLSAYAELIGVVVVPEVPWTAHKNSVREVAPGLRVAVSANELDRWLHGE